MKGKGVIQGVQGALSWDEVRVECNLVADADN